MVQRTLLESPLRSKHVLRAMMTMLAVAGAVALVLNFFSGCTGQ